MISPMMSTVGALFAADDQPAQAGPLGLFIILALGVATVFLIMSMSRHLKRIPPSFDPPTDPAQPEEPAKPADPPAEEPHSA